MVKILLYLAVFNQKTDSFQLLNLDQNGGDNGI